MKSPNSAVPFSIEELPVSSLITEARGAVGALPYPFLPDAETFFS